jgi:hypothetical protein
MTLHIVTADERLAAANIKTTVAIFGPPGVGKTSLLQSLLASTTICVDLEAGLKSVQDWRGDSIPITELTRQCMAWAKTRPEAFSEKTGKPDVRGAYGLLAREVIALLKHMQHAWGKTVIFVGVLERIVDEFNREHWQPQMEGGKAARELPAIVDQVITMSLFEPDGDGWRHEPSRGQVRRFVCRAGNRYALPAKDRSGRLDVTEPPDLGALLAKINRTARSA